ncbi:hypothetical protein V6N12_033366 [Hibiscus sabdariffa]|uniref:Uncharacterized protein n=1 Tax=Hibiscus sabdariffa TaxID=183260 RepID=A0ABR2BVD1_9ROSI
MAASLLLSVALPTKTAAPSLAYSQPKPTTAGLCFVSFPSRTKHLRKIACGSNKGRLFPVKAIEESKESVEDSVTGKEVEAEVEASASEESELSAIGAEIKKAMKEREAASDSLAGGVAEEIREIEWPAFGKVLRTTGVVLGVIAGSSVVLLTVNAVLAELSDRVFAVFFVIFYRLNQIRNRTYNDEFSDILLRWPCPMIFQSVSRPDGETIWIQHCLVDSQVVESGKTKELGRNMMPGGQIRVCKSYDQSAKPRYQRPICRRDRRIKSFDNTHEHRFSVQTTATLAVFHLIGQKNAILPSSLPAPVMTNSTKQLDLGPLKYDFETTFGWQGSQTAGVCLHQVSGQYLLCFLHSPLHALGRISVRTGSASSAQRMIHLWRLIEAGIDLP